MSGNDDVGAEDVKVEIVGSGNLWKSIGHVGGQRVQREMSMRSDASLFDSKVKTFAETARDRTWKKLMFGVILVATLCVVLVVSIPFLTTPLSELGSSDNSSEDNDPDPIEVFVLVEAFAIRLQTGALANETVDQLHSFINDGTVRLEIVSYEDGEVVIGVSSQSTEFLSVATKLTNAIRAGDPQLHTMGISSIVVNDVEYIVCPLGFSGFGCFECLDTPEGDTCRALLASTTVTPTTVEPTTPLPTTEDTTTVSPTTEPPTTTEAPTTEETTTLPPTTPPPTTVEPSTTTVAPSPTTTSTVAPPAVPELDLGSEIVNSSTNSFEGRVYARPANDGEVLNGRFEIVFRLPAGTVINSISMTPVLGPVELEPQGEFLFVRIQLNLQDSSDGITVRFTAQTTFNAHDATIDQVALNQISSSTT